MSNKQLKATLEEFVKPITTVGLQIYCESLKRVSEGRAKWIPFVYPDGSAVWVTENQYKWLTDLPDGDVLRKGNKKLVPYIIKVVNICM